MRYGNQHVQDSLADGRVRKAAIGLKQVGAFGIGTEIASVHERCPTREAAIEAGRRLLAEKVEWLGAESFVEALVYSALERRPEGD